jgi:hypothetical protein
LDRFEIFSLQTSFAVVARRPVDNIIGFMLGNRDNQTATGG